MNEFRQLRGSFLEMDFREFNKLAHFFHTYPMAARKATAQFLNDLGFRFRPLAVTVLASRLIMRSPKFILSRMRVQKTSARPINQQRVIVGSTYVHGKGGHITFDGFRSLQGLAPSAKDRTISTVAGRGGNIRAKAKSAAKLMPDKEFPTPDQWDDMSMPTKSRALAFMIRDLSKKTSTTFIVPKGYGMSPGLYRIKSKAGYKYKATDRSGPSAQIVQHFGRAPHIQTWKWINETVKRLIKHAPIAKLWREAITKSVGSVKNI